jgi:hypothetical protein
MTRNQGENDGEYCGEHYANQLDPHGPQVDEFADIPFANADKVEGGRLGLLEQGEKRGQGVVRRKKKVKGYDEGEDHLNRDKYIDMWKAKRR